MPAADEPETYTTAEVAKLLRMDPRTVRIKGRKLLIPGLILDGKRMRFSGEKVREYLRKGLNHPLN